MKYNDVEKIYYDDDNIISGGTKIQIKLKKIKVAFLDLDLEINKI